MENIKINDNYSGIDFFKLIMAIFVVAIHTNPLVNCENLLIVKLFKILFSTAVPFFFLSTGFFLEKKIEDGLEINTVLRKYILKIIKLYIFWSFIYLPLAIWDYKQHGYSFFKGTIIYFRNLIFVGEHYNSWILWYLLSAIYACCFIFLLKQKLSKNISIVIIGLLIFIISSFIDYIFELNFDNKFIFFFKRYYLLSFGNSGRIFTSFFYIPLGMYIFEKKDIRTIYLVFLILLLFILCIFCEGVTLKYITMFLAISIFFISKKISMLTSSFSSFFRMLSTGIYFIHMYVWTFYYSIRYQEKKYGLDSFLITVLFTILICSLFIYFQNHKKRKMELVYEK